MILSQACRPAAPAKPRRPPRDTAGAGLRDSQLARRHCAAIGTTHEWECPTFRDIGQGHRLVAGVRSHDHLPNGACRSVKRLRCARRWSRSIELCLACWPIVASARSGPPWFQCQLPGEHKRLTPSGPGKPAIWSIRCWKSPPSSTLPSQGPEHVQADGSETMSSARRPV